MDLVTDGGLEGLTIQRLAQKMDWAVGALYRYFPSKDALLAELQCRVVQTYGRNLSEALEALQTDDGLVKLIVVARHYRQYLLAHPTHFRLISLALSDPKQYLSDSMGLRVMQEVQAILIRVAGFITEATAAGSLDEGDIRDRTLVFWSCVQGVLQLNKLRRFAPDTMDTDRLLKEATATLLRGWGAEKTHLATVMKSAEEATS
jgi:AcrR family transcriptional regulator